MKVSFGDKVPGICVFSVVSHDSTHVLGHGNPSLRPSWSLRPDGESGSHPVTGRQKGICIWLLHKHTFS